MTNTHNDDDDSVITKEDAELSTFDSAEYIVSKEDRQLYLNISLKEEDGLEVTLHSIGSTLGVLLRAQALSRLVRKTKIDRSNLCEILLGEGHPTPEILVKIAEYYGNEKEIMEYFNKIDPLFKGAVYINEEKVLFNFLVDPEKIEQTLIEQDQKPFYIPTKKEIEDVLGAIYMESGMGNKSTGQFFTPFHLSKMCASVSIPETNENGKIIIKKEGRKTQKEEAFNIGGKALRAAIMGLFASLIKDIIQKLVSWFRSGERKFKSFITSVTDSIKVFVSNIKQHLKTATNTFVTAVTSAIFGPIVGMLKKAWIFLKQGWKSLKEAVAFLRNPENKQLPFSLKMLQVGKIVVAGLTAGGAILLGEVIEKSLMTIPIFAIEIPFLGSLANLLGIFLGALISGIIGALALNIIDRKIANKQKKLNLSQQHDQRNEILKSQETLLAVSGIQLTKLKTNTAQEIVERHTEAADKAHKSEEIHKQTRESLNEVFDILNDL